MPEQSLLHLQLPLQALPCSHHPPLYPELPLETLELSTMGTPNDQAVLQAIFNPNTPFGDVIDLDLEEAKKDDEGKPLTLAGP